MFATRLVYLFSVRYLDPFCLVHRKGSVQPDPPTVNNLDIEPEAAVPVICCL